MVRKLISLDRDSFEKYVVCPKCHKLYNMNECTKRNGRGETVPVPCSNKTLSRNGKVICGSKLVKEVIVNNGSSSSKVFYPLKVYCYNSITNQFEQLLKRPGFPQKCEEWRGRESHTDVLYDVFDGEIWKSFKWHDGSLFFDQARHYGLMMNVDWFQPFKRRTDYSVGVIYFVLMNLPRKERFKVENVIIAGIIPALEKPGLNTFLEPVVDELKALWHGLSLANSLSPVSLRFSAALLCVAADVPAARKACGFKSHAANKGCSKCMKNFPGGFGQKKDYSGFERQTWKKRSSNTHNRYSKKLHEAKSLKEYEEIAKKYGIHYSVLVTLEYFDAVRLHVIDPMHNLFLGIAKKTWKIWMDNIFSKKDLANINQKVKDMNISTDVGRIGSKISSNYGTFTAQEWKNWTNIHSMHVLSGILPSNHLMLWQRFVYASRILCQPIITKEEIMKADALLLNFCKDFETLYGKYAVTPNMHLCCHVKDSLLDFGPVYAFWLFSFERYNGEMASNITNNRSVEIQYMRKFITGAHVNPRNGNVPELYKEDFEHLFSEQDLRRRCSPSHQPLTTYYNSTVKDVAKICWEDTSGIKLPEEFVEDALDREDKNFLWKVYNLMFPGVVISADNLSQMVCKYTHLYIGEQKYGSLQEKRGQKSARLLASWLNRDGDVDIQGASMRPGIVNSYISHKVLLTDGQMSTFVFALVKWHKMVLNSVHTQVWKEANFEPGGPGTFLPVQRVHCRFVAGTKRTNKTTSFVVCPVTRKSGF